LPAAAACTAVMSAAYCGVLGSTYQRGRPTYRSNPGDKVSGVRQVYAFTVEVRQVYASAVEV
jgi:hypothetical protein